MAALFSWPRPTRTPTDGCTVAGTAGTTLPMASQMGHPGTRSAKVRAGQQGVQLKRCEGIDEKPQDRMGW